MTFRQPFASPEVDLEGMCPSIISAVQPPPFHFPTGPFLAVVSMPLHFSLFLPFSVSQQKGSKCKSSRAVFFRGALISADDVSKEVRGDNSEATAAALLYSPPSDLCLLLSFCPLSPHSRSLFYHIFNIISIDRAVHLEPLFNNWLLWLIRALMVSACGQRERVI